MSANKGVGNLCANIHFSSVQSDTFGAPVRPLGCSPAAPACSVDRHRWEPAYSVLNHNDLIVCLQGLFQQ